MNCQRVQRFLSLYHDGHSAGRENAAVSTHVRDCPACRQFRESLTAWSGKLRTAGENEPSPRQEVRTRALDRWTAHQQAAPALPRRWPLSPLPRTAVPPLIWGTVAVALCVVVLTLGRWEQRRHNAVSREVIDRGDISRQTVPRNPKFTVKLAPMVASADGTKALVARPPAEPGVYRKATPLKRAKGVPIPPSSLLQQGSSGVDGGFSLRLGPRTAPKRTVENPPSLPDDQYLDGRDPSLLARWNTLGGPEKQQLQAVLRKLRRPADDFVRIPFPLIATAGSAAAAVAAAARQYDREAKVVDPRLFRKVTLQDKGVALSDLCAELQSQTGVQFRASRSVADEKATVFVKEERARDVMRAISHLFGYPWVRSTRDGEYRYELDQDLRSQLAEEERRSADIHAALLAMDEQAQAFRPYLEVSYDEFRKRWDQLPRGEQRPLVNVALNGGWGAMLLYHRLTPRDRAALIAGQEVVFRPGDRDPDHRLSDDLDHKMLMAWNPNPAGEDHPVGELPGAEVRQVRLKLDRTELGQVSLSQHMTVAWKGKTGDAMAFADPVLATGRSPSVANPDNAAANAPLRGQSPFDRVVSVHPEPTCPQVRAAISGHVQRLPYGLGSVSIGDLQLPHVFSADVWEAVHRTTGLPIVTDYYTRMFRLSAMTVDRKPLFDALCSIGDALGVRWKKDGDFITGRSTSYVWDKVKEVPNRDLQRWIHVRDTNGGLPMADMLEMASLPDEELDSRLVGEAIEHCWGLPEWWSLSGDRERINRRHARFLAILTPEQVSRALRPEGLPFRELTPAQQQASIQLNYEDTKTMEWQNGSADPVRADWWPHCVIYIEYVPAGWYAWNAPESSHTGPWNGPTCPIGGRTAAEALAAARRIYPPASPQDVQLMKGGRFWAGFRFEFHGD